MEDLQSTEPDQILAKAETYIKALTHPKFLYERLVMWDFAELWEARRDEYLEKVL